MDNKINLFHWGLKESFIKEYEENYQGYYLGRVVEEQKNLYKIVTEEGKMLGKISGKMSYNAIERMDYPTVGDWVVVDRVNHDNGVAIINGILKRKSKFSRKVAGNRSDEQIVAANVDNLFICMTLNNDFNLKRLERYISLAWNSGATPVILLTKSDLCEDINEKYSQVDSIAFGIDIIVVSSVEMSGIEQVKTYLKEGSTIGFVGSSGVGKSTLVNSILNEEKQLTKDIGNGDKGRHTTTYRELIQTNLGGVIIDTPGMREVGMLGDNESIYNSFKDIEEISARCKFTNCSHRTEVGCAIKEAMKNGNISVERYNNYLKLKKEAEFMERKSNKNSQRAYVREIKKRNRAMKKVKF
ncbi:ribosome small subunit-dependent GTPase A [Clostridium grantii]|uniref:Small ribosomal subunit biogenesis GTPase RsgA n=1 Tax=Clostridium grantii DSM 8605 TaxID=1121316 RepID=A0A1M5V3R4_9CLOT|nr:ribosome small subunit-dependent GTPase A [Clostridium grantii]SHH69810.1 ribosome biogenesis GTPase [Clostridium grantii DSM 8605]